MCSQSVAVSTIDADTAEQIVNDVLSFVPAESAIANEALQLKAGALTMRGDLAAAIELRKADGSADSRVPSSRSRCTSRVSMTVRERCSRRDGLHCRRTGMRFV